MTRPTRTRQGDHWNEGARQCWLALKARGWTQGQLNRELGRLTGTRPKLGYANRAMYGDLVPGLQIALAFETLLGVSPTLWNQPALEKFSCELNGAGATEAA